MTAETIGVKTNSVMAFVAKLLSACVTFTASAQADITSYTESNNLRSNTLKEFPVMVSHVISFLHAVLVCGVGHFEEKLGIWRSLCKYKGDYAIANREENNYCENC